MENKWFLAYQSITSGCNIIFIKSVFIHFNNEKNDFILYLMGHVQTLLSFILSYRKINQVSYSYLSLTYDAK